jgi:hypothetical protein
MTTVDIVAVGNDLSPIPALPRSQGRVTPTPALPRSQGRVTPTPALPRSQGREQQGGLFHEGYDSNGGSTD